MNSAGNELQDQREIFQIKRIFAPLNQNSEQKGYGRSENQEYCDYRSR
jgi:hypothetical protein